MEQAEPSALQQLFDKAKESGGFQYLYALVRIDGIQCYHGYKDELVENPSRMVRVILRTERRSAPRPQACTAHFCQPSLRSKVRPAQFPARQFRDSSGTTNLGTTWSASLRKNPRVSTPIPENT